MTDRANDCAEEPHQHMGICQRAGYANGLADAQASVAPEGWRVTLPSDGSAASMWTEAATPEIAEGSVVLAWPATRDERALVSQTVGTPWQVGGTWVVRVAGYSGGIALTHVEVVPAAERVERVHNHAPYRPMCAERRVEGQLRGACLDDEGSDA